MLNAAELARELRAMGVVLSLGHGPDRVRFDAPAGAITDEIRTVAGTMRDELLSLVEAFEERAGVLEYEAGLDRAEAERCAWAEVLAPRAGERLTTASQSEAA